MILIFDSSPLIALGKVRILEKIEKLPTQNWIPETVYHEVVLQGKSGSKEDAFYLEKLIEKKIFTIIKVKSIITMLPSSSLSQADQEVLSVAKEKEAYAVIDEDAGRSIAELLGIKTLGSVGILFNLLDAQQITKPEMKNVLNSMVRKGWYCSPALYSYILDELEKR